MAMLVLTRVAALRRGGPACDEHGVLARPSMRGCDRVKLPSRWPRRGRGHQRPCCSPVKAFARSRRDPGRIARSEREGRPRPRGVAHACPVAREMIERHGGRGPRGGPASTTHAESRRSEPARCPWSIGEDVARRRASLSPRRRRRPASPTRTVVTCCIQVPRSTATIGAVDDRPLPGTDGRRQSGALRLHDTTGAAHVLIDRGHRGSCSQAVKEEPATRRARRTSTSELEQGGQGPRSARNSLAVGSQQQLPRDRPATEERTRWHLISSTTSRGRTSTILRRAESFAEVSGRRSKSRPSRWTRS